MTTQQESVRVIEAYALTDRGTELRRVSVLGLTDEKRASVRRRLTNQAEKKNQAHGAHRYSVQPIFSTVTP